MNKGLILKIVSYVGAVGGGFGLGFLTKHLIQRRKEKKLEAELINLGEGEVIEEPEKITTDDEDEGEEEGDPDRPPKWFGAIRPEPEEEEEDEEPDIGGEAGLDDFDKVEYEEEDISSYRKPSNKIKKPHAISVEEYGEKDGYATFSYHFYPEDGTVTDERDERIDDWRARIGVDALSQLEIYEDLAAVYVRNDARKEDYEVLRVEGPWEGD